MNFKNQNMKEKILALLLPSLLVLVLAGAGCSLGAKKGDTSKDGGVYKSTDAGVTWTQTTAYPTAKSIGNIGTASIKGLIIDPQDHEVIYAGTSENGLIFSYNSSASWQSPKDTDMQGGAVVGVAVDPKDVCTIYLAAGSRLFKTEDCGREFVSVYDETRSKTYTRRVAVDWFNEGVVYLGLSNGDILKSVDSGQSWSNVRADRGDISDILISNQDSRVILVGTNKSLWKSSDGGITWIDMGEALKDYKDGSIVFKLVQTKDGSAVFAATKYGLLKSTDFGETWEALKLLTSPRQVEIKALAIDPIEANKIYYATSSTFYKTVDGGTNWTTQKISSTAWGISFLLVDPEATDVIYMGREAIED